MKKQTVEAFHALMKKGWIDRTDNPDIWDYCRDPDVKEELETMKEKLGFELVASGDHIYLVPTQDNDLFLKNNVDFRKDISANNEVRTRDLYLMNYLSVYLLYMFYNGEGTDPRCREFISKEDATKEFSDHCRACTGSTENAKQTDYSDNFIQLANAWLSKTDGAIDSMRFDDRYGILNRLLVKFNSEHDDLFYVESENIRPSRKLDDLMPYFLRKDRISEIQRWVSEVNNHAADN
jgi:hypothetical protein